jgi:hypothetical protein
MTLLKRLWKLPKSTIKKQNIYNILLINMTQSCQIKQIYTFHLHLLNNTCVKHNFQSIHVSNLFWSREYNSAKEICKYPSFSKVGGNYPLDLKIIWSSVLICEGWPFKIGWNAIQIFIDPHPSRIGILYSQPGYNCDLFIELLHSDRCN